jgi:hypothetical protein
MTTTATSFVTLSPGEHRVADFHVVEETGALSAADVLRIILGVVLWIPALFLITRGGGAVVAAIVLLLPGVVIIAQLFVRPRVSEIVTLTNERVIHYRREHGRFYDGHAYQNVRIADISGVTTDQEHRLAGDRITIVVYTARADAMFVGAGRTGNLLARLLQRQNIGPDAERAIRELPALLPSLRAGEWHRPQAETVDTEGS